MKQENEINGIGDPLQNPSESLQDFPWLEADTLKEAEVAYAPHKKQGSYTVEDFYALSDENTDERIRLEMIHGVIYGMSRPSATHQIISAMVTGELLTYIRKKGGKCVPLQECEIWPDQTDQTILSPDIMILCDRSKLNQNPVQATPDLVIEILSPSTARIDKTLKHTVYRDAGVREYWIIDPVGLTVAVYDFEKWKQTEASFSAEETNILRLPKVYHSTDRIPVSVFDGDCEIDFADICDYVKSLGISQ